MMPVAVPPGPRPNVRDMKSQLALDEKSTYTGDKDQPGMEGKEVDMQAVMEDAMREIQRRSQQLKSAARPYGERLQDLAEDRPVLFTFLAILTVLSSIPLCCFVGFILLTTLFVVGVAAAGICITMFGVFLFAGALLLPVLIFTTFLSALIVSSLIGLFLAHRLYLHLSTATRTDKGEIDASYENISLGVREWVNETTARVELPFGLNTSKDDASDSTPQYSGPQSKVEPREHAVVYDLSDRRVQWGALPGNTASWAAGGAAADIVPDRAVDIGHEGVDEATPRGKVQA